MRLRCANFVFRLPRWSCDLAVPSYASDCIHFRPLYPRTSGSAQFIQNSVQNLQRVGGINDAMKSAAFCHFDFVSLSGLSRQQSECCFFKLFNCHHILHDMHPCTLFLCGIDAYFASIIVKHAPLFKPISFARNPSQAPVFSPVTAPDASAHTLDRQ